MIFAYDIVTLVNLKIQRGNLKLLGSNAKAVTKTLIISDLSLWDRRTFFLDPLMPRDQIQLQPLHPIVMSPDRCPCFKTGQHIFTMSFSRLTISRKHKASMFLLGTILYFYMAGLSYRVAYYSLNACEFITISVRRP